MFQAVELRQRRDLVCSLAEMLLMCMCLPPVILSYKSSDGLTQVFLRRYCKCWMIKKNIILFMYSMHQYKISDFSNSITGEYRIVFKLFTCFQCCSPDIFEQVFLERLSDVQT